MPRLPGVNHHQAIKAFEKAGFWIARQGKHVTMTDGERVITIPRADPINAFTMAGNCERRRSQHQGIQEAPVTANSLTICTGRGRGRAQPRTGSA